MFNAAIDRKLLTVNPAKEIMNDYLTRKPSRLQKLEQNYTIDILSAEDTRTVLQQMEKDSPQMVAGMVLGFFAGIRTEEISRVFWNMIDLDEQEIHLPASVSKAAESRIIPLEANAIEWLSEYAGSPKSRVIPGDSDFRAKRRFEKARLDAVKTAGIRWVHNAARHSFGSYHSRLKGSEHETFSAMGHSNIRTFRKHYQNTSITKADCEAYWAIFPRQEAK